MQLPPETAHYSQRVSSGRYVTRRLRQAKRATLAADVEAATALVLKRGREWEDAEGPVQDALADRDAADDDLDDVAQEARNKLAGRAVNAVKQAPYTMIFTQGIDYYTAAPLEEETKRYGELRGRLVEHLPADDEVRKAAVPVIETGIAAFEKATAALAQARTDVALAGTRLAAAEEAWAKLMVKVFGVLVSEVGKKGADRFFLKPKVSKKKSGTTG